MESLAPEDDVKYHMALWAPHYSGSLDASEYSPAALIAPRVPLAPVVSYVGRRLLAYLNPLDFPPRSITSPHLPAYSNTRNTL